MIQCVIPLEFVLCFYFCLYFGQTRHLIRSSDFLSFFAYWARVITIGATQSEQHCCLGHAPASQSHVAHTQHCKKADLFLQRKWRRAQRFPNSNVHQTGLAPISDESAHNQGKKAKNLRYPQQTGKCPKRQMKQKHECKILNMTHDIYCMLCGIGG